MAHVSPPGGAQLLGVYFLASRFRMKLMSEVKQSKSNPVERFGGKPSPGRPKGVPNKATQEFRQTITALLEKNASNVDLWLQQVAEGHGEKGPQPEKALDLLAKLAEYAAPKLARHEHMGEGGGPLVVEITRYGDK